MASSPVEYVVVASFLTLIALGAALWVTGQVSARVFSGTWPSVSMAEMGAVVAKVLSDPATPGAAWPASSAHLIPGPVAFWTTFVALMACPLALVGFALRRRRRRAAREPRAADWATRSQLKPLRVDKPTSGRLTLGYAGRQLLAAEPRQSVIVIGPSQSGKTTSLAVPAILEWDGPVIATSVKADLLRDTIGARRAVGPVWVYDPTRASGHSGQRARWSPLDACGTWQDAQRTASWLVDAGRSDGGLQEADFWYATAAKLLAPLLFAAAAGGKTMADVVRWVDLQEEREVLFELEAAGVVEAIHAADASWQREERQRSSVYTTTETVLRAFSDPAVADSAKGHDITPDGLLGGDATTLYLCAPSHEQARLRPLFVALLQQMITTSYERSGEGLRRPLLIVLDEAANIAPLPDLDTLASTAAGVGIELVTVWQDLAQIHTRYGERASTVVNNHRAKLALSGISDPRTLEYFSRLVGETEISRWSTTRDDSGKVSTTDATHYRSLASDDALRQIAPNEALLVYGYLPPTPLRLRPWYRDRRLRGLADSGQAKVPYADAMPGEPRASREDPASTPIDAQDRLLDGEVHDRRLARAMLSMSPTERLRALSSMWLLARASQTISRRRRERFEGGPDE